MRNRLIFGTTILGLISLILFVPDVYKYLIVYFGWCKNIDDQLCIGKNFLWLSLYWLILAIFILFIAEKLYRLISKHKGKAFDVKEYDSSPSLSSISVTNEAYPIIEDCSIELIQIRVLNKRACQIFWDKNIDVEKNPKFFIWDNGYMNKTLPKGIFGKIKLATATEDEKFIILTNKRTELGTFANRRNSPLSKKALYQIEVEVAGRINDNGEYVGIKEKLFFEIRYKSDGLNTQNVWIRKIDNLCAVNNLDLGRYISQKITMRLVFNKKDSDSWHNHEA